MTKAPQRLFGEALGEWLRQAGRSQGDLGRRVHVDGTTVSHWVHGRRRLEASNLVRVLMTFHDWLGDRWRVADALDGIGWLGVKWEDVLEILDEHFYPDAPVEAFRRWWERGRPPLLPELCPPLPAIYVEREELHRLQALVTEWQAYRRPRWEGITLRGVAGIGKTTLLAALARNDAVRRVYHDGVLWLEGGAERSPVEQACRRVGLVDDRDGWKAWIGDRSRRLLVVVDDVVEGVELADLLRDKGPQVVIAVATQRGISVLREMERWLDRSRVAEVPLAGMSREEGRRLVTEVLGEDPDTQDGAWVQVAELLGWHPEGLRLAAATAGETGWEAVLADLEDGQAGETWDSLVRLLNRQWDRLSEEKRERIEKLVWRTERGGPLGVRFAAAVWDVEPERARMGLLELEQDGLVERVVTHPVEPWWATGRPSEMWRVTPIVYRVRKARTGKKRTKWRRRERALWRWRMFLRRHRVGEGPLPAMPGLFAVVVTAASLLAAVPKTAIWAALALLETVVGRRGWADRWLRWTVLAAAEAHLKARWEETGVWPTEELWLAYAGKERALWTLLAAEIAAAAFALLARETVLVAVFGLLIPATAVWAGYAVAWWVWLCLLYGVRTWGMAGLVGLTLALSWPLRWTGPVRRERERLQEVWERAHKATFTP